MSYQRLIHEHGAIDKLARRLEAEVRRPEPDAAAASALLGRLSLAVREHLREEDRTVYGRLIDDPQAETGHGDVDFEAAFQALSSDWLIYLADWVTADVIAGDWHAFVEETQAMMARLRQRIRAETDLIYPLALQRSFIRLRDEGVATAPGS